MISSNMIRPLIASAAFFTTSAHAQVVYEDTRILASDQLYNDFGVSYATNSTRVFVGAPTDETLNYTSGDANGAVYIYDPHTNQELHKLLPNDPEEPEYFGDVIRADDELLLVNASDASFGSASDFVYIYDAIDYTLITRLEAPAEDDLREFGTDFAIGEHTISVVAEIQDRTNIVYVYDRDTLDFIQTIVPTGFQTQLDFGPAIATAHGVIAIAGNAARPNGRIFGKVFLYNEQDLTYIQTLRALDEQEGDEFGYSIAIADEHIAIGALMDSNQNGEKRGSAYLFTLDPNALDTSEPAEFKAKHVSSSSSQDDLYAFELAISDGRLIVGAPRDSSDATWSGAMYVYDLFTGQELGTLWCTLGEGYRFMGGYMATLDSTLYTIYARERDGYRNQVLKYDLADLNPCLADMDNSGSIDFFDVSLFLERYNDQSDRADLNQDGEWNFYDVSTFLVSLYSACA